MKRAALLLLLAAPAGALPNDIWTHINTACSHGQVPVKNLGDSWSCGLPTAANVGAANVLAGTFGVGVLLPAANLTGVLPASVLPSTTVFTTGSYANPSWITSLAASKLTGTLPASVLPSTVAYTSVANSFTAAQSIPTVSSTMTIQGNAFSVGGSTFAVADGTTTMAFVDIGFEVITNACGAGVTTCTATCSAGKVSTGGDCDAGGVGLTQDSGNATSWTCGTIALTTVTAKVRCARIKL